MGKRRRGPRGRGSNSQNKQHQQRKAAEAIDEHDKMLMAANNIGFEKSKPSIYWDLGKLHNAVNEAINFMNKFHQTVSEDEDDDFMKEKKKVDIIAQTFCHKFTALSQCITNMTNDIFFFRNKSKKEVAQIMHKEKYEHMWADYSETLTHPDIYVSYRLYIEAFNTFKEKLDLEKTDVLDNILMMYIIKLCDDDSVGDYSYIYDPGFELVGSKIIKKRPRVIRGDFDYNHLVQWYHKIVPEYRSLLTSVNEMDTQFLAFREVYA